MSARLTYWGVGLLLSAVAHAGGAVALMAALQPEPVTEQPSPTSELDVQAYALDRDRAQEAEPPSESASEADGSETSLDPGAIPQSRASAVEAPSSTVQPASPEATQALDAAAPTERPLKSTVAPETTLSASVPETPAATSKPLEARPAPTVTTQSAVASAAALPVPTTTSAIAPVTSGLAAAIPDVQQASSQTVTAAPARINSLRAAPATVIRPSNPALPAQEAAPTPINSATLNTAPAASVPLISAPTDPVIAPRASARPSPPEATRLKAALAFPGGSNSGIDPVSLAAFQSFMQPGDIAASGSTLRDGVSTMLARVPCSRLQVAFDPETATLQVKGHLPDAELRAPVLAALGAQMGENIAVADNTLILPRPQCGALSGIANVGLPQSTDQTTNPLLIGNDTHARVFGFVQNDPLSFDISGPDYPAFIYVDYFDADGNVIHLAPNTQVPLQRIAAEAPYRIGTRSPDIPGLHIRIGPPYGQEIAVAFAASEPLYDGLRPMIEPAAPYLEWLTARVAEARQNAPDFKGEWVYFFVSTSKN